MREFFVLAREKCETCKGTGTVHGDQYGPGTCKDCDGSGGELKEVPLSEALAEMGVGGNRAAFLKACENIEMLEHRGERKEP